MTYTDATDVAVSKPIWLLDWDGVGNNFSEPNFIDKSAPEYDFKIFEAVGFRILYSPSIMKRIVDLHENEIVEVRWLTTWMSSANVYLREQIGFTEDLIVEGGHDGHDYDFMTNPHWWKEPIARSVIANNDRVIWTDDEVFFHKESRELVERYGTDKVLAVAPNPCLTHKNLDTIEEWIYNT